MDDMIAVGFHSKGDQLASETDGQSKSNTMMKAGDLNPQGKSRNAWPIGGQVAPVVCALGWAVSIHV